MNPLQGQELLWQAPGYVVVMPILLLLLLLVGRRLGLRLRMPRAFHLGRLVLRHPWPGKLLGLAQREGQAGQAWRTMLLPSLVLLLVAASLAGPYSHGQRLPDPVPYREVVFIIDTSISMGLRDYRLGQERVDRMTMLKNVMDYFIQQLHGNRIGIITFSEAAYAYVPLSNDYALLTQQIQRLQAAQLTGRTSDVSQGLMYTYHYLQSEGLATEEHKPALVLLSDVQHASRDVAPQAVAAHLRQQGYTLHTIAIGAGERQAGEQLGMGLIYEPVNFPLLEAIAHAGGGQFFIANSSDSLKQAVLQIQESEQRSVAQAPRYRTLPLYHWPLLCLLGLIMTWQLWRVLRP